MGTGWLRWYVLIAIVIVVLLFLIYFWQALTSILIQVITKLQPFRSLLWRSYELLKSEELTDIGSHKLISFRIRIIRMLNSVDYLQFIIQRP